MASAGWSSARGISGGHSEPSCRIPGYMLGGEGGGGEGGGGEGGVLTVVSLNVVARLEGEGR